ncbi:YkgJ family cysteine cluster protein [Brucepastera parasyntrophica]|uniref:YkgJ family cysteine cluster protein n=1 Tax=Brucepastera parasyntrophica TaxID=2880008 RepID=UPI00210C5C1B|nr:YkgJ family cysteine cluster protein [Brucepastera parasyntrophica]ULQ59983.1 YkgJ family cysteine cluster protein [Brucepastera parasyntrophica]
MNIPFYHNGLRFECQRCSSCCRFEPGIVNLSSQDLEKLVKWSTLDTDAFISGFCRWVLKNDGYEYLCLQEKENYDCILWDNGCIAYESRPYQCSSYPFWISLLSDEDWWNINAQDCRGINSGKIYTSAEIENMMQKRRQEPYIRRKTGDTIN